MASALEGARGTPTLKPIWFISWQKWGRRPSKIYFYIFINPMTPWIVATASTSLWNTFYSPSRYTYSEGTGTASLWWCGVEDIFGLYSRSTLVWTRATQSPPKYSTWWYMWSSTTGSQRYWRRKGAKIYFYIFINPMTPWIVATASTSLWNTFYSPSRYTYSEGTGTASLWWCGVEDIFGLYSRSTLVWTRATQSPPKYSTWWYMWSSTTGSQRYWRRKGESGTEVFERYIQHLAAYFYSNDSILASMRSEILQR